MPASPRRTRSRTALLAGALSAAAGLAMLGGPPAVAASTAPPAGASGPVGPAGAGRPAGGLDAVIDRALARQREHGVRATAYRPADGSFVQFENWIFEIVGGAPVYVSTWAAVGGKRAVTRITAAQWAALPDRPADGTFVTASDGRVYRFVAGVPLYVSSWTGFGARPATLRVDAAAVAHAGSDDLPWDRVNAGTADAEVTVTDTGTAEDPQATINLNSGIFLRGATTGRIYQLVGGAPVYVSSWAPWGGRQPAVTVDQVTIDRAGQPGPWRFLARSPMQSWLVRGGQTGQTFSIAGGAPVYVATATILNRGEPGHESIRIVPATVDQTLIDRTDGPAPYNALRTYPADGTLLYAVDSWQNQDPSGDSDYFRVAAGVAVPASDVTPDADPVPVDRQTLERAGQDGVWSHLRSAR